MFCFHGGSAKIRERKDARADKNRSTKKRMRKGAGEQRCGSLKKRGRKDAAEQIKIDIEQLTHSALPL